MIGKMGHKVSVIITTYNRSFKVLKRSINSVLNQTYSDYEIIVVNDTPKELPTFDEIASNIKEFGDKINYLAEGINRGACFARNQGFKLASGDYLAFLDDDDEWLPIKLEEQVNILKKNKHVMVTGLQNINYENKRNISQMLLERIKNILKTDVIDLKSLLLKNTVGGCSIPMITREAFIKCEGFKNELPSAQDYDLWIKLACIGEIYCIKKPLINYYVHDSERISTNSSKKIEAYKYLIDRYQHLAENKKPFLKNKYLIISYHYYKINDFKNGDKYFKLAKGQKTLTLTSIYYSLLIMKLKI